jgi:hypothetical protein
MGIYIGGRQIFETSQEVHKRGVSIILDRSTLIIFVIGILREDLLSTGILDMFFRKYFQLIQPD